ncbi:Tolloid-like protein 1 [Actinoplanes sp. SE50]|uniref:M12 family metallopeptidase n=1 Tax=unclassified Actinoplanes TaxID=2626549 RepID=UPI00023EC7B6|nr:MULTISPECIES: M12 family metallopeptidase [unclassified Actinoplanes]AEV84220.1 Tolloid-like protein 1 [Actinoplanes sp. SE50/110]ATO82612.1 Tolloid-like protein 1 [Actinoplanes sp. SE50]SLM00019.1 Tolloid-like protein 1 [Actinoplanes sp. SE50/110]
MTIDHLCLTEYSPRDLVAFRAAPAADAVSGKELAFADSRRWQTGQELVVRFMDGDARTRARVEEIARAWLEHANLRFTFADRAGAELRVTFTGSGYWSFVGTEALAVPSAKPTIQLGGLSADDDPQELRAVVLHEFGHAIGCVHEQASPAADIPWDVPAVYKYYLGVHGWSAAKTEANVLHRYANDGTISFTDHDPESIMQYAVPRSLTLGGYEIGWNTDLSDGDKQFIAAMYPPADR